MIPVYKPYLNEAILKCAHDALDSTWLSAGRYISEAESALSTLHYGKSILTCCNGTAATHLVALLVKRVYPKIKKIIVPNNVYVAAWNAFLYDSNFELIAVDADPCTWNVSRKHLYKKLYDSNLEDTALLVAHNLGNIVNVPQIRRDWKDLVIVEDNCEGFFGFYEGQRSGTASFASSLSFFGNKNITSGEGGAVIVPPEYKEIVYKMKTQGQSGTKFIHDCIGYNYRMTNIQAALIVGQLQQIYTIRTSKHRLFKLYKETLSNIENVLFQKSDPNTDHALWMFGIRIKGGNYPEMEKIFKENAIEVRPMFYPIYSHEHLKRVPSYGGTHTAETLNRECVVLPSYPELQNHEIRHIANVVKEIARNV